MNYLNKNFQNVKLHLITGPMFSGKTTKLIAFVDDYLNKKKPHILDSNSTQSEASQNNLSSSSQDKVIIFKNTLDDRFSLDKISTHDKVMRPAIRCQDLTPYLDDCKDKEVVAIDEGQFFNDLYQFICALISLRNKTNKESNLPPVPLEIVVDALDGDFLRRPFGQALDLLPICYSFVKLRTIWKLDNKDMLEQDSLFQIKGSAFSLRTVKSLKIKLAGGEESYQAASRSEYMKKSQIFISTENKGEKADKALISTNFGFISVFIGQKKSGKTKELIKKIFEIERFNSSHTENETKTVIFISTDSESISQNFIKCKTAQTLPSFSELADYDCILIDDIHLYPNSATLCDDLANSGKFVFVSGSSADENGEVPAEVKLLIPMSESVTFLDMVSA